MRGRLTLVWAVTLVLLASCDGARSGTGPPRCDRDEPVVGVHQDLGYEADAGVRRARIDAAATVLHAGISRNSLLWDQVEPGEGRRDWSRYDEIVDDLHAHGVDVLLVVVGSPPWANGGARFDVPLDDARFHAWVTAYARFAAAAADRYQGRVRWEVWNEPNSTSFWRPHPDAARYAAFYSAVRAAIVGRDPGAQVASGGVNSLSSARPGGISGAGFLTGMHDAGVDPDIVAVHPYPDGERPPASHVAGENNVDDVASVLAAASSRRRRPPTVWVTELGWNRADVGDDAQAQDVGQALDLLSRRPEVKVVVIFIDRDTSPFPFGLLSADGAPRPAANAFAAVAARRPPPCPAPRR